MTTPKKFVWLKIFLILNSVSYLVGSDCTLKSNGKGVCTNYKNCNYLINKLRNREIEFKDVEFCNSYGIVCCPKSGPATLLPQSKNTKTRICEEKCKEYTESTKQINYLSSPFPGSKPVKVVVDKCNHKSVSLIIGGTEAMSHEFPHHAVLGRGEEDSIDWICGGSLISPQFILTAAHCSPYAKFIKIGINSLSQSNNQKIYKVTQKIVHPDYDRRTTNNDIALLKLNQIVELNENIHPICLPTKQFDEPKAIVSGFGKTSYYDSISDKLLKVTLEKFSYKKCRELYDERLIDDKTMFCYGHRNETKDSCEGDSGGPLQVSNEDQVKCTYKQIGIVSFGPRPCGYKGFPGVYVNVFNYIDWIEQIVWKNGI